MSEPEFDPTGLEPDRRFDGGDLDCGSGLALLIRERMLEVPEGGVLEIASLEATVADDLPPWCRLSGHAYLGSAPAGRGRKYYVRRGGSASGYDPAAERASLEADKAKARDYVWRLRVRTAGFDKSVVYCRNASWTLGVPASYAAKDEHPSAVEALLGALAADLGACVALSCREAGVEVDDLEMSVSGSLAGSPADWRPGEETAFSRIEIKCFVTSLDEAARIKTAFETALARSPLLQTLNKAVPIQATVAVV